MHNRSAAKLPLDLDFEKMRAARNTRIVVANRLWFANNTSGIKSCRFSFLAAQLSCAMPSAAAGNVFHGRL
jgi:hypothetical protein